MFEEGVALGFHRDRLKEGGGYAAQPEGVSETEAAGMKLVTEVLAGLRGHNHRGLLPFSAHV